MGELILAYSPKSRFLSPPYLASDGVHRGPTSRGGCGGYPVARSMTVPPLSTRLKVRASVGRNHDQQAKVKRRDDPN